MPLAVRSHGWDSGKRIPAQFTADGEDRSPRIEFSGVGAGVRAFALIFDDPDAPGGTWVHWVIYNIPGSSRGLAEGVARDEVLTDGIRQGRNSWNQIGYQGPSPPPGKPHHYILHLYALSEAKELPPGLTADAVREALRPLVVSSATYTGTYGRDRAQA